MSPSMLAMSMPEIALIFFMGVFIAIVLRLAMTRSDRWAKDARIPLDESGDGGTNNVRN